LGLTATARAGKISLVRQENGVLKGGQKSIRQIGRHLAAALALVLALVVLGQGARLVFHPDALDDLRQGDALFAAGRYHAARAAYVALVREYPAEPRALLRLGIVYAVRDERDLATQALAGALGAGLAGGERDLARLYQGRLAEADGRDADAARFWNTIGLAAPLLPLRRALEAESLLAAADYAGAEAAYRAALELGLPPRWRNAAHARLALLRASSDPQGALAELAQLTTVQPEQPDWTAPLLPVALPDIGELAGALGAPAEQRAQLLGQIFLQARLYDLAEAQFSTIGPGSAGAIGAAAYAAYTRWIAGDRAAGLQQLQALAASYPRDARARALLALVYLSAGDQRRALAELEVVRALAPRASDTHLAWSQWHMVQHDYVAAAGEYARALSDAAPEQRGEYALAQARFHIGTSLQVCEAGRPAADEAARLLPGDARALVVLAATRVSCGDPAGAREAAAGALGANPGNAEASYYLGRALAQLGERSAARAALVGAADLAPASSWRERAEAQIAALGL
jgi:hypothetical protein